MEYLNVILFSFGINITILASGAAITKAFTSKEYLLGKGYPEEYIDLVKKQSDNWGKFIMLTIISIQIVGFITAYAAGFEVDTEFFIKRILSSSMILVLFAASIKYTFFNKTENDALKKAAIQQDGRIFVDYKFEMLHLMLHPFWELPVFILMSYFIIARLDWRFVLILYSFLPWFFYFITRSLKNQILPMIKHRYEKVAYLMIIYQSIKTFLFTEMVLYDYGMQFLEWNVLEVTALILLELLMIGTIIRGIVLLPRLKRKLASFGK